MNIEKRITYYADGKQLWTYKELAKKYDVSVSIALFHIKSDDPTRPQEVARMGKGRQQTILFNAEALDNWFAPKAEIILSNIARRRGRPRKK